MDDCFKSKAGECSENPPGSCIVLMGNCELVKYGTYNHEICSAYNAGCTSSMDGTKCESLSCSNAKGDLTEEICIMWAGSFTCITNYTATACIPLVTFNNCAGRS